MGRGTVSSLLVIAVLTTAPPRPARAEPPPAAAAAIAPALPRAGAMLLMDTPRGTVWDVIYPPGVPTPLHRHAADFVGVELVASRLKLTSVAGEVRYSDVQRGEMYMLPKGLTHIEEGVAGYPQRNAILIELKDAPSPAYPTPLSPVAGIPAVFGPRTVDNARLSLWDARWTPREAPAPFFQSRDLFIVPIDPGVLSIESAGEATRTLPVAGGQVVFLPGGRVRTIRAVEGAVRAAVVELK